MTSVQTVSYRHARAEKVEPRGAWMCNEIAAFVLHRAGAMGGAMSTVNRLQSKQTERLHQVLSSP